MGRKKQKEIPELQINERDGKFSIPGGQMGLPENDGEQERFNTKFRSSKLAK
jgi:hypothetical protein